MISASDTRDNNKMISKQYPSCEEISGATTKPTQAQLYWHQIWRHYIKTIPQPQGDIRCEHKTNSASTVSTSDTRDNNKMISKQYPSCKEISGARTKPTLTQVKDNI